MVRKPPSNGPKAVATPATAPHTAKALARSDPSKVLERMARVAGSISDAPMPSITASPTSNVPTEVASDATSDPMPKSADPMMNMRRAPYTSPRRPPMMRNVANVNEYPVTTHWSVGRSVSSSRWIVGSDTLSTELSRTMINTAMTTMPRVTQRRGSGVPAPVTMSGRASPTRRWP